MLIFHKYGKKMEEAFWSILKDYLINMLYKEPTCTSHKTHRTVTNIVVLCEPSQKISDRWWFWRWTYSQCVSLLRYCRSVIPYESVRFFLCHKYKSYYLCFRKQNVCDWYKREVVMIVKLSKTSRSHFQGFHSLSRAASCCSRGILPLCQEGSFECKSNRDASRTLE